MSASRVFHTGLIGWPLEHSLSPRIHQIAFRTFDLEGGYRLYPVPPGPTASQQLTELIGQLKRGEIDGLNVTIPYKTLLSDLVKDCTTPAAAIGAFNTLYARDGRVVGDNTDAAGFMRDIQAEFPGLKDLDGIRQALILGAGGAARAVAYSLLDSGWRVGIAARSLDKAKIIAEHFKNISGHEKVEAILLESGAMLDYVRNHHVHLLVNATPIGMHPYIDASPWPVGIPFPEGACVYDLIYNPPLTLFVKQARASGLHACTGLGMLIEQAALSFELWTGMTAPRAAIRQDLIDWRRV